MGIPRLTRLLEPYAEQVDIKGRDLVIDGPALAYHILYHCQKQVTRLYDLPSYKQLGDTAVRWLNELSNAGANISSIYFDGYLPSAKEPERKKRLLDLSKGLRSYFSLYPSGVPKGTSATKAQGAITFSASWTAVGSSQKPPTPPFLVPAVLEALCAHETYRLITKLIPGEADIFCARHVQSSGGIIITSDSDLLVHELGKGSVAFFNSVEFKTRDGTRISTVAEYSIPRVCDKLSIPRDDGLSPLAFEVSSDPQVTIKQALQRAKEQKNSERDDEYAIFWLQYFAPETLERVSLSPVSGRLLDPRISELVLKLSLSQKKSSAVIGKIDPVGEEPDIPMYLPFLVDSPARTSAWENSTSLRALAYAVGGLLTTKSVSSVVEYRRLQTLPGGTRVEIPHVSELDKLCTDLADRMANVRAIIAKPETQWIALAIHQDIVISQDRGKNSILSLDLLQAEANGTLDIGSWDFVQLHAQVQGLYYSLRMLEQICGFVSRTHTLPESVSKLQKAVGHISILDDFPSISQFASLFPKIRVEADLTELVASLGLGDEISARVVIILNPRESKKKRKRSKRSAAQDTPRNTVRRSNNPFDLLGDS